MADDYVHGYSAREQARLLDQAATLTELLFVARAPLPARRGARRPEGAAPAGMVYVDASRPGWVEGFTRNTFTAMVEGVEARALAAGLVDPESWRRGIAGLRRAAGPDGVFCYTFFKGVGVR